MLSYPVLVVEANTSLYTVGSPPCKGASLESANGATQKVDRVSRDLRLEDGGTRPWSTPGEGGPNLARETSPTCDGRDLDSGGSGPTRSRGGAILPIPRKKRSMSTLFSFSLLLA